MTIREYLENPMGRGDSSIPNRRELINSLETKYQNLIRTKGNSIKMDIYMAGNKADDIYFHIIIPTETERTNSYDVVFLFSDPKREHTKELSISNYYVRMFSNSPSFAYTFAHVYMENNMFINILKNKMEKEIIKREPDVRNRFGIINYEKYLYFGARFIVDSKMMNRAFLSSRSKKYSPEALQKKIRSLEVILAEYNVAKAKVQHAKRKENQKINDTKNKNSTKTSKTKEVAKKTSKRKLAGKVKKIKKL